jgi:hypothetical protein
MPDPTLLSRRLDDHHSFAYFSRPGARLKRQEGLGSSLFLDGDHLASAITSGLQIDVMRAAELA